MSPPVMSLIRLGKTGTIRPIANMSNATVTKTKTKPPFDVAEFWLACF